MDCERLERDEECGEGLPIIGLDVTKVRTEPEQF